MFIPFLNTTKVTHLKSVPLVDKFVEGAYQADARIEISRTKFGVFGVPVWYQQGAVILVDEKRTVVKNLSPEQKAETKAARKSVSLSWPFKLVNIISGIAVAALAVWLVFAIRESSKTDDLKRNPQANVVYVLKSEDGSPIAGGRYYGLCVVSVDKETTRYILSNTGSDSQNDLQIDRSLYAGGEILEKTNRDFASTIRFAPSAKPDTSCSE